MSLVVNNGQPLKKSGKNIVFSFRIDEDVYALIKEVAAKEKRSINAQLEIFVENGLVEYLERS